MLPVGGSVRVPSFSAIEAAIIPNLVFILSQIPSFLGTFATNVHIRNYTVLYAYFVARCFGSHYVYENHPFS